jgi:hypothetical protein
MQTPLLNHYSGIVHYRAALASNFVRPGLRPNIMWRNITKGYGECGGLS